MWTACFIIAAVFANSLASNVRRHEVTPKTLQSCELHHGGSDLVLSCPEAHVIQIQKATFGRTEDGICPAGDGVYDCNQDDASDKVLQLCEGNQNCTVSPTTNVFGDPCLTVPKYLTISYLCQNVTTMRTCELHHGGSDLSFFCPDDHVIRIQEASYGRTEDGICPKGDGVYDCSSDGAFDKVIELCEDKEHCVVSPTNDVFGDPCPTVPKYLTIAYLCEDVTTMRTCELHHGGSDLVLSCPAARVIHIVEASYGRTEDGICPGGAGVYDCDQADAFDKVMELCEGNLDCTVSPTNSVFGDPCATVPKYLTITYLCAA